MDADTGEETAIRILFLFLDPPKYYTISKQSLCASGGEWGSGEPSAGV